MAAPGRLLQLLRQVSRVRSPAVPEWGRAMLRRTAPVSPPRLPAPRTRQMVKASPLQRMYFLPSGRLRTEGRYTIEPAPLEALLAEVHGMEGAEATAFAGFLRPLLQKDPARRPPAAEMLKHAWLKEGEPEGGGGGRRRRWWLLWLR